MNLEDKNSKFKKSKINDSENEIFEPQTQRNKLKLKIMEKYNLNPEEAEKILLKIENKRNNADSELMVSKHQPKNSEQDENYSVSQKKFLSEPPENNYGKNRDKINNNLTPSNLLNKTNNIVNNQNAPNKDIKKQNDIPSNNKTSKKNVDSILGDIIPDYNQQVSINVDHVDLTFEVQNEKVDTLKETFIRTLKRNIVKKIKIHALKDVSFKIYKGEKVGIIGYNGAGKSTLLNVITGIYPPDKGSVVTFGNISPLLSLGAGFDYNFSGKKNIILNGAVLGYEKEFLESKMDEIIEFSELGELIDIPIKNYSSGMLAKLGFSIATAVEPDILIIDEILGVGDVNFQKKSRDKMKSLMDGGTTVLLVSHSIPQIRELCDKAIWIDQGHLREIGEVNKVCDHYMNDAEKASKEQLANIQFR